MQPSALGDNAERQVRSKKVGAAGCCWPTVKAVEVLHLYISAGHNYFGHHEKPPGENLIVEVDEVRCVAGQGIEGDRFFGYKKNYKGQITFFAWEVYEKLCEQLGLRPSPQVLRRNVITRGTDLNSLIGKRFELQGVEFEGTEECRPCYWMDQAFGEGANEALKGFGGLRARILTSGVLHRNCGQPK